MSVVYVDTSAALRATVETGTTPAVEDRLIEAETLLTSRLALVESARTFHRLRFLGEIPEERLDRLKNEVDDLWDHCEIWELTPEICELAASLEAGTVLRTLDALHLATFLRARQELPDLEVLLTADDRLQQATEYQLSIAEADGMESAERNVSRCLR